MALQHCGHAEQQDPWKRASEEVHADSWSEAAALSLLMMPSLWWAKVRTARALGSRSLGADAKETMACAFLSAGLLAGLGLNALFGLWWADPVTGLCVAAWLAREGVKTLREDALCSCASVPRELEPGADQQGRPPGSCSGSSCGCGERG